MSKVNDVLEEIKTRLLAINSKPIDLTGKVVVCYNDDDLLKKCQTTKTYPVVGVQYEGMRSTPDNKPSGNLGLSSELVISLILVEQGETPQASQEKKTRALDYLDEIRDRFLGERSLTTGHQWRFVVEAPAYLKDNMVCWVQRWSVPVQQHKRSVHPVTRSTGA